MENLDATVLSTALPAIAHDLHQSPIQLKLALTSYLLTLAVFIPASGWVADRFGTRIVFRLAILIFALGSALCGFAGSIEALVAARALQGIGGAMMVPVGRLVILRTIPRSEFVGALAWLTIPALMGPVLGPPVGGFITTYFTWRWIFWINLPMAALGIALATLYIPNVRGETVSRFDYIGFILSGVGLAALVSASATLDVNGFPPVLVIGLFLVGSVLVALYVFHARRAEAPIVDLKLLRFSTFRSGIVGGSFFRLGVGAMPLLLPLLFQLGFGMTPLNSGLLTFVTALGAIGMKTAAGTILKRFGFRNVLLVNSIASGVFDCCARVFHSEDADQYPARGSLRRRLFPVTTVYLHQCDQRCRGRSARHEPGDELYERLSADCSQFRHYHGRVDAPTFAGDPPQRHVKCLRFPACISPGRLCFTYVFCELRPVAKRRRGRSCRPETCRIGWSCRSEQPEYSVGVRSEE